MKLRCPQHFFVLLLVALSFQSQVAIASSWQQIKAPHTHIIFKKEMTKVAQRIANMMEFLHGPVSSSIGVLPAPIPLVIWDENFSSNGCFCPGFPRRIEFFTAPSQDYNFMGSNNFIDLLGVHELRHAVQYEKLMSNSFRWLRYVGGDITSLPVAPYFVPTWFLEGDAVATETALTKSGRGRIPYFALAHKVNLLEKGGYPHCKHLFGSLRDKMPTIYQSGYFFVTHLRRNYGEAVISKIIDKLSRFTPFPLAVKAVTGKSVTAIHEDANAELKELWEAQQEGLRITPAQSMVQRDDEVYTDYSYPQLDSKGNIIVLKEGLGTVKQFVSIDKCRQEHPIFVPGDVEHGSGFTVAQDQIVWTEQVADAGTSGVSDEDPNTWLKKMHSVINRYDVRSKPLNRKRAFKRLTHRSRYQAAAISPDATQIVAVETDKGYRHRLVILDATSGKALRILPNPNNYFYLTPKWLSNGHQVVAVKHYKSKTTLAIIDTITGESEDLLSYTHLHIGCPVPHQQYIFYNSGCSGIDNIYALDLETGENYQVTSRKYGAYNPVFSPDGRWIIFNDFTKHGMDVAKMPFDPESWIPMNEADDRAIHYYAPLVDQENNADVLERIPEKEYAVMPYTAADNLLKVHSWLYDTTKDLFHAGFNLQSKDLLDKTRFSVGYVHNTGIPFPKEDSPSHSHDASLFFTAAYRGMYPIVQLDAMYNHNYDATNPPIHKTLGVSLEVPYTYQYGQYTNYIGLIGKRRLNYRDQGQDYEQTYTLRIDRSSKKSARDIASPWSQALDVSCKQETNSATSPSKFSRELRYHFGFPGLFRHHSLSLWGRYSLHRKYDSDWNYSFPETKWGSRLSYDFPVIYPDWSMLELFYWKQLFAGVGLDSSPGGTFPFAKVVADVGFIYFHADLLRLGCKASYKGNVDDKNLYYGMHFEPIFELSFTM